MARFGCVNFCSRNRRLCLLAQSSMLLRENVSLNRLEILSKLCMPMYWNPFRIDWVCDIFLSHKDLIVRQETILSMLRSDMASANDILPVHIIHQRPHPEESYHIRDSTHIRCTNCAGHHSTPDMWPRRFCVTTTSSNYTRKKELRKQIYHVS